MKNGLCFSTAFFLLFMSPVNAQHHAGRWALGAHADANMWFNDLNQRIVGLGGNVMARYGVSRHFSLGLEIGAERLKTGQNPISLAKPYDYFRLDAIHFSLLGYYHFLPGNPAAPYAFVGLGILPYSAFAPNKNFRVKKASVCIPFGVGIETFIQKGIAYDFHVGYVLLNDATETIRKGIPDGYFNVRFGLNFYLGTGDDVDEDGDGLTTVQEGTLGTNPTNADTDEDGLDDGKERHFGTDPGVPDCDGDMLKDGEEVLRYLTDPLKADSDGDGISDGDEVFNKTDPRKPDTDGGGVSDAMELANGTNPLDPRDDSINRADSVLVETGFDHPPPIRFAQGTASLDSSSIGLLKQFLRQLRDHPEIEVEIRAYTDNRGSRSKQLALSRQRAIVVKRWLEEHGILPSRLSLRGFGSANPVATNRTAEGREKNNRIDFWRTK